MEDGDKEKIEARSRSGEGLHTQVLQLSVCRKVCRSELAVYQHP